MVKVVHNQIAHTAKAIAREAYESLAHSNDFYVEWPNQEAFVQRNWPMFVDQARASLMQILTGDYPQAMKDEVYEAMLIDGQNRRDPNAPKVHTKTAGRILH